MLQIKQSNGISCTMADSNLYASTTAELSSIYYSPKGYWKGLATVNNLSATAKVSKNVPRSWLKKQAVRQIYLPAPRHIPR